jgi:glycolate oxidase FAD binding subunit
MAGSFGTLGALVSVTFKVLPVPDEARTLALIGADERSAIAALSHALQSPHEITGAAHLPAAAASASAVPAISGAGAAATLLRVEGPGPAIRARLDALSVLLKGAGQIKELDLAETRAVWREIRDVAPFAPSLEHQVWRLSVPPMSGPGAAASVLRRVDGSAIYDWGGGLVWLFLAPADDAHEAVVRAAASEPGSHATLIRASEEVRARTAIFEPLSREGEALTRRIKENFDPKSVLNPGRMYAGI